MNPIIKKHGEKEPPGGEKKSTAETELKSAQPKSAAPEAASITPRAPPGTAGTPITVTPYIVGGATRFYMVGTVLVGSEQAAAQTLKNLLFQPPIPS